MTEIDAQRRILQHALSIFGVMPLAAALRTSYRQLEHWSAGEDVMPSALLDRTADLILARYRGQPAPAWDRPLAR